MGASSSRSAAKNVLAVRMLVARTKWLEGNLFWREGQVAWTTEAGETIPDARELSRTQKCLNKIGGFPHAAPAALGDAPAWLVRQRETLALAKRLRALSGMDAALLAQEARRRNPAVAEPLSHLLIAEALCLNSLPAAPSEALAALGRASISPLQTLLSEDVPQAVRALAALVLGAISREDSAAVLPAASRASHKRAYLWGREHGVSREPALAAALLVQEEENDGAGGALVPRCLKAVKTESAFGLSAAMLREMLADGLSPTLVTELAEAASAAETIAERLLKVRADLPDLKYRQDRQAVSEARRAERQRIALSLVECLASYARSSRDPQVLRLGVAFLRKMLDLSDQMPPHSKEAAAVLSQMADVMQGGLKLPPAMQRPYFELLVERYEVFWRKALLRDKPYLENGRVQARLLEAESRYTRPLHSLLTRIQDKAVVVAAFDRDIARDLAEQEWTDPDFYRLSVSLAVSFDLNKSHYFLWRLHQILDTCASAAEARAYFRKLLAPLQGFPSPTRIHVLVTLWSEAGHTRQAFHDKAPKLIPFLPALAQFAEKDGGEDHEEWCVCDIVVEAALTLVEAVPNEAKSRIEWLLGFLSGLTQRKDWEYQQDSSFRIGMLLAIALAAEDADRFQQAVRTAASHRFRQDQAHVKDGLRFVERYPALRRPLAHLLAPQPQRVTDVLVRLGMTTRLGTDVSALLTALEPQQAHDFPAGTSFPVFLHGDTAWWDLHRQMPEFTEAASAYCHAQWVMSRTQDVPPGVRRALDKPQRTAVELAHLEKLIAASPDRTDIAARAAKLCAFLADTPRLTEEMRTEVSERLPQAAAEAQVAAIERQVLACYRTRLEAIAGPLPPGLVLTDDLINAALLSVDVTQNRKLLLRLIRAHLSGENDWREKHPANQVFLEQMTERGRNIEAWLSKFPHRYPCAAAQGWLHLSLEQDPLHILQMGNHFGTCLSFGGINAFSAIANACELNKRVIYARDHAGNIVGRKLIGISAEGALVGFHTYGSLTGEDNAALRAIFQAYAASFAGRCGLPLAEEGTVPTLFAESWYDDGTVEWNAEGKPEGKPA